MEDTKTCVYCREQTNKKASHCKNCGKNISVSFNLFKGLFLLTIGLFLIIFVCVPIVMAIV